MTPKQLDEMLDRFRAAVRGYSQDDLNKVFEHPEREHLGPFKKSVVTQAVEREGWADAPIDDPRYEDLIFNLCMAQEDEPDKPGIAHQWALLGVIDFLEASKFHSALIRPLREARNLLVDIAKASELDGKPGRRPMPDAQAMHAAFAAAAVTILSRKGKCRSVKDSLKLISKASGLDRKWLDQFRLNLLRGSGPTLQYKLALTKLEVATEIYDESDEDVLESVSKLNWLSV